ncbi:MAG: hypothetical protein WB239_02215 [Acidimicrobiia bacterium]
MRFRIAWILLALTGAAIVVFGVITAIWSNSDNASYVRAAGVASIGMGVFGLMITLIPFRRREMWAWFTLWYYPVFWLAQLVGALPPGSDHIHQIMLITLSATGLLIPVRDLYSRPPSPSTGS